MTIRRSYYDCKYGQLHIRSALPDTEIKDAVPLICFHQSPQSGKVFTEILNSFGQTRPVYAPDTPGFGESDPPTSAPSIEDFADVMEELIDQLGLKIFDILGYHTGALTATEIALRRPELARRLVLIGLPVLTQKEIDAFFEQPWPVQMNEDGSHITTEWERSVKWAGPGMTLPLIQRGFVDKLKAGDCAFWGGQAAMRYPFSEKLPRLQQPILAIGPKDDLWEISPRSEPLIKNGSFEKWPDHGFGLFDVAKSAIVKKISAHLDV